MPATSQFGIGAGAAQQIAALVQDKLSRTPAQKKISSQLLYTIKMLRGQPVAAGVPYLETGVELDDNQNLFVDIRANVTDDLLARLRSLGVLIVNSHRQHGSIRAMVAFDQVEQIAAWPDIYFIGPRQEATTNQVGAARETYSGAQLVASGFEQRAAAVRSFLQAALPVAGTVVTNAGSGQGSQSSEGDVTHKANVARSTYGVSGAGIKIGVLSDGVTNLASSQALQDLGVVTVLPGQAGSGDEGTAMLEIVHDLAPGARLYFATAENGIASFAQNIRDLRTAGCDIIVDDVTYFLETRFQDGQDPSVYSCMGAGCLVSNTNGGIVVQAVNDVVADGALYFSSAANSGNQDDGTSGTWEGDFVDGGPATGVLAGDGHVHVFDATTTPPTTFDTITAAGGSIVLTWSDPLGASANDYDLYVLNAGGSAVVASSTNSQSGTQDPAEIVSSTADAQNNRIVVVLFSGQPRFLDIATNRGKLAIATTGATFGHNAANQAFGVAATPAISPGPFPNPFNAGDVAETFSSDGPRRIFFHADGTPITAGNFSSTGGQALQKPDITAADGVSVSGVGGFGSPFYGTSAAAPHAAAIAGLVKSAKPTATTTDIRTALTTSAIDIMAAGWDRDSGAGIVMADAAIAALGTPAFANPDLGTLTAVENPGNGDGYISAGEGAKVTIQLQNKFGAVTATNVTATLTTTTSGVTITQPNTSAYPNLAAGSGVGTNSFTFTLGSGFPPCGTPIEFTLTVNYTGGPSPRELTFTVPTGPPPVTITNPLGTTPATVPGVTTLTGTQTGRVNRNGVDSTCGTGVKPFPGTLSATTSFAFDSYSFTACRSACAVIELTPPASNPFSFFTAAYSPSFNPGSVSTNYIGDAGASFPVQTYSLNVSAANTYTVVVHEVSAGAGVGQTYNLLLPGCAINCAPVNQPPVAKAHDVTVAAGPGGTANASVDNGSFDPDGDPITTTQTPPGPYSVGTTSVLLTVVDTKGATAQASAMVTVTPVYTLTVASTNPSSGVPITVSPSDNNGQSNGTTQFTRTYNNAVVVSLGAAASAGGNNFSSWTGCDSVAGTTCTVTMNPDRPVSANYGGALPALRFIPLAPCRIADTRNPNGAFGGPAIGALSSRDFVVPNSSCGIPATAAAYSLNVTVVPATGSLGYLTIWPTGQPLPLVSTLNSYDGRVKANAAIVPAGNGGAVSVYVTDLTNVILDINGYFVLANDASAPLAFFPVTPCRLVDTRNPSGSLGGPTLTAGQARSFPVRSSSCNLPATAQAYSLNFTAVPRGPLGYLTTWPTGTTLPLVSTLNAPTGTVTANAAILPAGTNGDISVYVTDASDVIIDVNGYFAPATSGTPLSLYPVAPCRVVDTRQTTGSFSGSLQEDMTAGSCGIPASAKTVVLNATVVPSQGLGFLTLWPDGQTQPLASTLNAYDGQVTSNMAIVPTSNSGAIDAFATDLTQLILDTSGYFASGP